ncbi:MAG: hypothetical protein Q4A41_04150, partial [Bacillota bacterium]|nr:hypothetical protein [Bacillota bacterium]
LGSDYPLYESELKYLADDMYENGSFGVSPTGDTVFLLFSTSTRKYNMVSFGSDKFDKNLIKYGDKVVKAVMKEVKDGKDDYYQAGIQFATMSARYGKIGAFGKFMSLLFTWYMPAIAFVLAVIIIAVILSTHKGTIDVTERTYEKSGTYRISNREDRF